MSGFLHQMIYIVIVALFLAAMGIIAVVIGEKNDKNRNVSEENCNFSCGGCGMQSQCHKPEKDLKKS